MNKENELIVSKSITNPIPLILMAIAILELMVAFVALPSYSGAKPIFITGGIFLMVIALVIFYIGSECELHITNKRVYGKGLFGKRIDIPVDSISSVGTSTFFKGVVVSSSSSSIYFTYLENAEEIHNVLSELITTRQSKVIETSTVFETPQSCADEIKKFKELLDMGAITQEEFEQKKKELLGL